MNIKDAVFVVVDTETTGLDPEKDKLVEIAAVATTSLHLVGMWATLVDPGIPIPAETMGIHGITDSMVMGKPGTFGATDLLRGFEQIMGNAPNVAHNAAFDQAFIEGEGLSPNWLCTKRLSQHLWPDAPNHRNQTLRYWRDLKFDDYGIQAHRALGDAIVTAALLRDIIANLPPEIETVEQLQALSDKPILYKTYWFGKHYAEPIIGPNGPDKSYISWALKNVEMDADKRFSLEEALKWQTR